MSTEAAGWDAAGPLGRVARILDQRRDARRLGGGSGTGRTYRCHCGSPVFFTNSYCLSCQATLGYVPALQELRSFRPGGGPDEWRLAERPGQMAGAGEGPSWQRCGNFHTEAGCNWMVASGGGNWLCPACRLNRTIPDLSIEENGGRWSKIEAAKRRLVAHLFELGLPVTSRLDDPWGGLAFDFLGSQPGHRPVLTGHAEGVITLNIEEADDVVRERLRAAMNEPYRTLLGHFRHEIGHYYWDRLIRSGFWLERFRAVFGDERADYAEAVRRNYAVAPVADWASRHVTAYASVHPWEDWAETWAHYMHVTDALTTAVGFGLGGNDVDFGAPPFAREALYDPDHPGGGGFLTLINSWVELTAVLNELARSMGQRDLYPFVLTKPVVAKLHFVHLVIEQAGHAGAPAAEALRAAGSAG